MKKIEFMAKASEKSPLLKQVCVCTDEELADNIAIIEKTAYNGEYTVEDVPDPVTEPTQLEQIEAQVTYTALMTDTLLDFEEE